MNIAIWLIDIKVMRELKHLDKVSYITALIVAFITLVEDPIIWIIVGTILALMLFVRRVSKWRLDVTIFRSGKFYDKMWLSKYLPKQDENDSIIVRFPGTINYINAESFVLQIKELKKPKHMVFSFGQVVNVDIDGIEIIDDLIQSFIDKWVDVYITWVCSDEMIDIFKKTDKLYSELKKQWKVYKSSAFVLDELKLGVGN
jgi:MFS superfamily sulfate permease-like transporter